MIKLFKSPEEKEVEKLAREAQEKSIKKLNDEIRPIYELNMSKIIEIERNINDYTRERIKSLEDYTIVKTNEYTILNSRKFEYMMLTTQDSGYDGDALNRLGLAGWEVVSMATYDIGGGLTVNGIGSTSMKVHFSWTLKREILKLPQSALNELQSEIADLTNKREAKLQELKNEMLIRINERERLKKLCAELSDESEKLISVWEFPINRSNLSEGYARLEQKKNRL